jgi:hypothetical protein
MFWHLFQTPHIFSPLLSGLIDIPIPQNNSFNQFRPARSTMIYSIRKYSIVDLTYTHRFLCHKNVSEINRSYIYHVNHWNRVDDQMSSIRGIVENNQIVNFPKVTFLCSTKFHTHPITPEVKKTKKSRKLTVQNHKKIRMHPEVHYQFKNIFNSFNTFINQNSRSHFEIVRHLMGIAKFFILAPHCFLRHFKTFKWNAPNDLTYQVDDMTE